MAMWRVRGKRVREGRRSNGRLRGSYGLDGGLLFQGLESLRGLDKGEKMTTMALVYREELSRTGTTRRATSFGKGSWRARMGSRWCSFWISTWVGTSRGLPRDCSLRCASSTREAPV